MAYRIIIEETLKADPIVVIYKRGSEKDEWELVDGTSSTDLTEAQRLIHQAIPGARRRMVTAVRSEVAAAAARASVKKIRE